MVNNSFEKKRSTATVELIDQNQARIDSLFVAAFTGFFIMTDMVWIMIFVVLNLFLKGYFSLKDGVFFQTTTFVISKLRIKEKKIKAEPKSFAAKIEFLLSLSGLLFFILGAKEISEVLTIVLLFSSGIEAVCNICIGSYMRSFIRSVCNDESFTK